MTTHGSIESTNMSNFDPENEALVSTKQLDQDYIIDNSALRDAFPDFSTGSTQSDISIEMGRGYSNKRNQIDDDTRNRSVNYKENIDPVAFTKDIKEQDTYRRQRDRPALGAITRKGSRFSPPKTRPRSEPEPTSTQQQPAARGALLKTLNAARKPSSSKQHPTLKGKPQVPSHAATNADSVFVHHPNTTTFSEAVTGTLHFESRVERTFNTSQVQNQMPAVSVPVPQDQQAVFAALKMLQEKLAGLEEGQARMLRTIDDLRSECTTLKQELNRTKHHRSLDARTDTRTTEEEQQPEIDPDEEDLFDISIPQSARPKSRQDVTARTKTALPPPSPRKVSQRNEKKKERKETTAVAEKTDEVTEIPRDTTTTRAKPIDNTVHRVITVPSSQSDQERNCVAVEVRVNVQGLSSSRQ